MASGSVVATIVDAAVNFTVAHLRLDHLNASSPPTWWDSRTPAGGSGLGERQRLIRDQAYRDFTTTVQVFILISSLIGKTFQYCQTSSFYNQQHLSKHKDMLWNCWSKTRCCSHNCHSC